MDFRVLIPTTRIGLLFACLCVAPETVSAVPAIPVAFAGEAVPGAPGETFGSGLFGQVNDSGEVALTGRFAGSFEQGIFLWDAATGGTPTPLVLPGDAAPGAPAGVEISSSFVYEMTDSGTVGYSARFATGPGGVDSLTDRAIYRFVPGVGYELLAREGDVLPGTTGGLVLDASPDAMTSFNASGEVVFQGLTLTPPFELGFGLWHVDQGGAIAPIATDGDPAPGGSGLFYAGLPIFTDINDAGGIAFNTTLATSATATTGSRALFGPDGVGGVSEIIRVDGPAPGIPGALIGALEAGGEFQQNNLGQVAFVADMEPGTGGVTSANNGAVWLSNGPGNVSLQLREGDAPPGLPGTMLNDFEGVWLNDAGDLALGASLENGVGGVTSINNDILLGPDGLGGLTVLAREGDAIPALPGDTWGGLLFAQTLLNDDGDIFFTVTTGNGRFALFFADATGGIDVIVAEGDDVDLGGGDVRTVTTFISWDASDDLSQYAITANFSDGTAGLFLVTIPEPASGLLLTLGMLMLVSRVRS